MLKFNPFKPGSIVHPGMFAGRLEEINALENSLFQTKNKNPSHFVIHGERGIGKSSLLMLLYCFATGEFESLFNQKYNFLALNVELDPNDNYSNILSKIAREFERVLALNEAYRTKLSDIWNFLTKWEVLGVKYQRERLPPETLLEELTEKFITVCNRLGKAIDGIYVFIDEADKPPASANLGEFVKVFTERLTKRECLNIGVGIVGISTVLKKLRISHESSVRILQSIELGPLLYEERKQVVTKGLTEANRKNTYKTEINDNALDTIANISEGYPHFIQQYAYSSFEADINHIIEMNDVIDGLFKEKGALNQLGLRYFENWYSGEIFSDDYRQVLQIIASNENQYTTRKEIIDKSDLKKHTVDNALTTLKKKNIIIPKKGRRGEYKLPSRSFAAWICAFKIAKHINKSSASQVKKNEAGLGLNS